MVQFPQEFLERIQAILPAHLNLDDFVRISGEPLRPAIRVNTLKIPVTDFVALMAPKGWRLDPIPWCAEGFWLEREDSEGQLGNTPEHLAGLFYIQEASSMMPPQALFHLCAVPDRVLDVASAPGSKTTQIAARMGNQGLLIANEYSSSRLRGLHANLQRMGVHNTALTHFDGRQLGPVLIEQFDAILLDAPCSGEGTIRKDPDAMKNWSMASIEAIAEVQKGLIESAFAALKPGGVLVYSTCTLLGEENQAVCHHLKQQYPDQVAFESLAELFDGAEQALTEEGFLHIWPQIYDSEGFFVAALRKTGSVQTEISPSRKARFPFVPCPRSLASEVEAYLADTLGLTLPQGGSLMQRDKEIWWFPNGLTELTDKVRFNRLGTKLVEQHKHGFKPQHQAAVTLPLSLSRAVALDREQARHYLMGRDVAMNNPGAKGEVVVYWQDQALGLAKWVGNKLKNSLPRDLVRDNVGK
ncbi:16S rRNA (cytosine(1407)-C(5))-methyltransferase RsmF [Ferrimonas marina]|uniref:Ribosomal RNA small subunit methyltransferase F n=1 Tax=Ferrimonas marina TaxID=299255 RepID=A0A1M5NHK2_9GAMM|nr:16S rRNA (cytosine(1407)-C(5))-methyltransferase RsmF [Ferrimonas marina]SHG89054.1 16S rRNA (cytosine1407-C5)-methyltransferase [Ferrimonas marina]